MTRTPVYGSLAGILSVICCVSALLTQAIIRGITGIQQESPLAIVASALLAVALFQPLRQPIQRGIGRRFYRRRYDATRALERLAVTLRREVDLQFLAGHLTHGVQDTMQPEHLSLWLRPIERHRDEHPW